MTAASLLMSDAERNLQVCRETFGFPASTEDDINKTGMIGYERTAITTSVGNLRAKRTTTNPNFAGLIVLLFHQAGIKKGDVVAVGASSSFPALILAVLSAAEVMEIEPLVISSLGASQWGANDPDFHWLDMLDCLGRAGILSAPPIALSLGGDQDQGEDMFPEGRSRLLEDILASGLPYIDEPDLRKNVASRMDFYLSQAGSRGLKAFVNIGGSYANMGIDPEILRLKPGLSKIRKIPPPDRRGILYEMAARGIPVIHLLFVKGLTERYGLPYDPQPLPRPGEGRIYRHLPIVDPVFTLLSAVYVFGAGFLLFSAARRT